jgi:hypothetical protein
MKMATIKFNKKFQSLTRREEAKYEGSNWWAKEAYTRKVKEDWLEEWWAEKNWGEIQEKAWSFSRRVRRSAKTEEGAGSLIWISETGADRNWVYLPKRNQGA